jgi:7,8-dihydroneopterin aldolase/epimerase/oxygenase
MSKITIVDLEVQYHVGVSDEERAKPQRLLITVDMNFDFSSASATDRITKTIDYHAVAKHIIEFGVDRSWKLIEKVVKDVTDLVIEEFQPASATVTVKKFALPQASHVAVTLTKQRTSTGMLKRAGWGIP